MKIQRVMILLLLGAALVACQQNEVVIETPAAAGDSTEEFDLVGRWEMVGEIGGLSYVYEFYADNSGVSFASPHSYRDIMFYVDGNDIRIDYYQGGEVSVTEIMEISFDRADQITLKAQDAVPITLIRVPIPETPAFVRARVALLVSNEAHTILEAVQEDERTWIATVEVAGEDDPVVIKIYLDDAGVWMPSFVDPEE